MNYVGNALTLMSYSVRTYNVGSSAYNIYKKSTQEEEWTREEYFEVAGNALCLVSEAYSLKTSYDLRKFQQRISSMEKANEMLKGKMIKRIGQCFGDCFILDASGQLFDTLFQLQKNGSIEIGKNGELDLSEYEGTIKKMFCGDDEKINEARLIGGRFFSETVFGGNVMGTISEIKKEAEKAIEQVKIDRAITHLTVLATECVFQLGQGRSITEIALRPDFLCRLQISSKEGEEILKIPALRTVRIAAQIGQTLPFLKLAWRMLRGWLGQVDGHIERNIITYNNAHPNQPPLTIPPRINRDAQINDLYRLLPEEHEDNPIFSRYICTINGDPCRYPIAIQQPNGVTHYYELIQIFIWVARYGSTDPLTRAPLDLQSLNIDVNALHEIETEMRRLGIPL